MGKDLKGKEIGDGVYQRKDKKYRDPDVILEYIESRIVDEGQYYILLDEQIQTNEELKKAIKKKFFA